MNKVLPIAAAAVMLGVGAMALSGQAQEMGTPAADTNSVFAAMTPDSNGTVAQKIMNAPAGDVLALEIGRLPKQVYTKQDDLLYVVSGYGTASIGYPTVDVKPGSLVSIPRNTAFEVKANGNAPIRAILIATPHDNPDNKRVL
ncbi:MAG TPA: cupin domain-containing protein [Candidatus Baltobacteraceae bacterium]|nr:cupin domain-containing protein [Candidatus Baltobacteraceae bacterium]